MNGTNITTVNEIETDITELVVEKNAVDSDVDEVMDWVYGTDTESELICNVVYARTIPQRCTCIPLH